MKRITVVNLFSSLVLIWLSFNVPPKLVVYEIPSFLLMVGGFCLIGSVAGYYLTETTKGKIEDI